MKSPSVNLHVIAGITNCEKSQLDRAMRKRCLLEYADSKDLKKKKKKQARYHSHSGQCFAFCVVKYQ